MATGPKPTEYTFIPESLYAVHAEQIASFLDAEQEEVKQSVAQFIFSAVPEVAVHVPGEHPGNVPHPPHVYQVNPSVITMIYFLLVEVRLA